MLVYLAADDDMVRLLAEAFDKYHGSRLRKGDDAVRVSIIQAWAKTDEDGNPVGAALKHHGVPCFAKVRIVNQRDRVNGLADAEILVDGDAWPHLEIPQRLAIIDQQLTRIEPVCHDDTGLFKLDDCGRPKLKIRLPDYQIAGFHEVRERHGGDSLEHREIATLFNELGQGVFAFVEQAQEQRA